MCVLCGMLKTWYREWYMHNTSTALRHMTRRGNRYYLHWGIPKDLRHLFGGRSAVTRTLCTSDLALALTRRDLAIEELRRVVQSARGTDEQQEFRAFLDGIRRLHTSVPVPAVPEVALKVAKAPQPQGRQTAPHLSPTLPPEPPTAIAQVQPALSAAQPAPTTKPGALFKETLRLYLKEHEATLNVGATSRLKVSPALFLQHLGTKDIHLSDIDKRDVQAWVLECSKTKAAMTVKAYAGALAGVWDWAYRQRMVDGKNPFRDLNLRLPPSKVKRGAFTVEQVAKLLDGATPGMRVLIEFGLITGCRLGELTTLTSEAFGVQDGVHCFQIRDGKTDNAARTVPLPVALWQRLKTVVESGLWVREKTRTRDASDYWSAVFQKLKGAVLEDAEGLVFHSFRKMAATAYQRAGVFEGITAELLGHSRKGLTMSYGLYATGYALPQQLEAVNTMLTGQYMRDYLVLFQADSGQ